MVEDKFKYYDAEVEFGFKVPSLYFMPPKGERAIRVGISAVGGGTVGKSYASQTWIWGVWSNGRLVASGDDLRSGAGGATHEEMARTLCTFLAHDGEEAAGYGSRDIAQSAAEFEGAEIGALAYGVAAWNMLVADHERFAECSMDGCIWKEEEESERLAERLWEEHEWKLGRSQWRPGTGAWWCAESAYEMEVPVWVWVRERSVRSGWKRSSMSRSCAATNRP